MSSSKISLYFYYSCGHMGCVTAGPGPDECCIRPINEAEMAEYLKNNSSAKMYSELDDTKTSGVSHTVKGVCPACFEVEERRKGNTRSHIPVVDCKGNIDTVFRSQFDWV
ncbi:hypothetical protein H072_9329 [Dactylellina haptotyla CBS 200.50]|uniref:Uncharacterized protein n=1 Tax=Dactylellina haptotyla (strain CBS 200.50) TaxID=1284197 RepID=S8A2W8_DACHA|nr:hypothetical protein H072_9329 [Dactylellina haptotyla CBS 200.50]